MQKKKINIERTITIEFFLDPQKVLFVIYNRTKMPFAKFWQKIEEAPKICEYIHDEFERQFPKKFKQSNSLSKDWEETFLKIVNNHLSVYDKVLDIFIRTSGEVVFKLER